MRVCDAAMAVMKETNNQAVMFGDVKLLWMIAQRAGLKASGRNTTRKVLASLARNPGELIPGWTRARGNCGIYFGERRVRIFRLPQESTHD